MKAIGEQIRAERKKRGNMNRFKAAKQIGISTSWLANIEQGQEPGAATMQKITDWLKNKREG